MNQHNKGLYMVSVNVTSDTIEAKERSGLSWRKIIEFGLEMPMKNETITKLAIKLDETLKELEEREEKIRRMIHGGQDVRNG